MEPQHVFMRHANKNNNTPLFWTQNTKLPELRFDEENSVAIYKIKTENNTYTALASERNKIVYPVRRSPATTSSNNHVSVPIYLGLDQEEKLPTQENRFFEAGEFVSMYPQGIHEVVNDVEKQQHSSRIITGQVSGIAYVNKKELIEGIIEVERATLSKSKPHQLALLQMYDHALEQLQHPIHKNTVIDEFFTNTSKHLFNHPKLSKYINSFFK